MSELKHELHNLRDENRRLRNTLEMSRKQEDIYISTLVEIMNLSSLSPMINDVARKTLFGLNGKGCPVGAVGKNGLTKEEIEGSRDE